MYHFLFWPRTELTYEHTLSFNISHLNDFLHHRSSAGKIVAASLLTVGGGVGGTILYAKWDPKFRANVEKSVPYSDQVFGMVLGPPAPPPVPLLKKPVGVTLTFTFTPSVLSSDS